MSTQATIYAAAFASTFGLISIFICLVIYKSYQVSKQEDREYEEGVQQRMQQVTELNLPPFYIDHRRDPVCVYDDEIAVPQVAICEDPPGATSSQRGSVQLETIRVESNVIVVVPSPALDLQHSSSLPPPSPPSYQTALYTHRNNNNKAYQTSAESEFSPSVTEYPP